MSQLKTSPEARLEVENVGGINKTKAAFTPGMTILTGRNATNRTSFLQAIMAVLGSGNASLKADADEGSVTLELDGSTYTRRLTRRENGIVMDGNPYLEDPTLAELFAFLLETNECRQAIARGDNLHDIIMEPVDTAEIENKIQSYETERDEIDTKIQSLDTLQQRLPQLEAEKQELKEDLRENHEALVEKRAELENADKNIEETRSEKDDLEKKLDELNSARGEIQDVRRQIDSEQESIDALQSERKEIEAELEELSPVADQKITDIDQQSQRLRGQIDAINEATTELQSVIQFNEEFLEEGQPQLVDQFTDDTDGDVTDELLDDRATVTCWTCGSDVETDQIETTLDTLRSFRKEKVQQRQTLKQEVDDLQTEKRELEKQRDEFQRLQQDLDQTEREIENRKETIETLRKEEETLATEITDLEDEVEELKDQDHREILELNEAVNKLEFEHEQLETELEDVKDEIDQIETQLDEREELKAQREEIQTEIENLRSRVEDLQEQAVDEFNEHMETVLDLLDYENLERIWIERTRETVREGRRTVEKDRFDLHVIRTTDDGAVFEDTVDHLSESEREVTGLVFALAGYLAHEVYETVPFMILDSIEAIDADRIASLVGYLEGQADYLVVALLQEDAQALDDEYQRITEI